MDQLEKLLENLPECKLCRTADSKIKSKLRLCGCISTTKAAKIKKPRARRKPAVGASRAPYRKNRGKRAI